jgi:hypothetical protein
MTQPLGRNAPCHCGSGKKYKRCCFAKDQHKAKVQAPTENLSLPLARMGVPGEIHRFSSVPVFPGTATSPPGGLPGTYEVTVFLQRPGFSESQEYHLDLSKGKVAGDSHLGISAPAVSFSDAKLNAGTTHFKCDVMTDVGEFSFKCYPNARGFLGHISMQIEANSFTDAEEKSRSLIAPVLSVLSVQYDVPASIAKIHFFHPESYVSSVTHRCPFPAVAVNLLLLSQGASAITPEARTLLNSYRDGINSQDVSWRFLCFSRIIHQLWKQQVAKQKAGLSLSYNLENIVLPSDRNACLEWLQKVFPKHYEFNELMMSDLISDEILGKTTNAIYKDHLKPIRDDIAHGLFEDGELPSDKNDIAHDTSIRKWLPLARCIARLHLQIVFPALAPS